MISPNHQHFRMRERRSALAARGILALAAILMLAGCRTPRGVYVPPLTYLFLEEGVRPPPPPVPPKDPNPSEKAPGLETASPNAPLAWKPPSEEAPLKLQLASQRQEGQPPKDPAELPPPENKNPAATEEVEPPLVPAGFVSAPITLAEAIDECLRSSLDIRSQVENVRQAQADVTTSRLVPNPTLLMLASLEPFPGHPFTKTKQGGPPQYDATTFWPIDWLLYGKRKLLIAEAERRVDVSAAEVANTARLRVSETVAMFFSVLEAKQLVQLSRENVDNLRRVTVLTDLRVKGEAAPQIDLDRARLALAGAQREQRTAELTLENAKVQLRALLGRREIEPFFDVAGDLAIDNPTDPPPLENIVGLAQNERSDVQAAQRRVESAMAQIAIADRDALPPLSLQAGYTYQDQRKAIGFPGAPSWNLGLTGPLPLFDRNQGNRAKTRAALTQASIDLEQTRIKSRSEVEQAYAFYSSAYKIVTRDSPQQLEAARSVRNRIEEAYRLGDRPLFEFLDASRTFRDTYRAQITAQVNYWRALHQLNAAAGQQILP